MPCLFITGSNNGFFNSLLITLQSFTVRLPGQRLLVCDYGMAHQQREFLRSKGQLLERPPSLAADADVLACKAALLRYLLHAGIDMNDYDAIIWIDADLTFMGVAIEDFALIVDKMKVSNIGVAACSAGSSIAQMSNIFTDSSVLEPFKQEIIQSGIDAGQPYFSVGLVVFRSQALLERWDELTSKFSWHPLYEQNMFNIVVYRDQMLVMNMDIEEWQAQGASLDKIQIQMDQMNLPIASIGNKNIKILHTTSPLNNHIQVIKAKLSVLDVVLFGSFKLLRAKDMLSTQLNFLASYVAANKQILFQLGLCQLNPNAIAGYEFVPLPGNALIGEAPGTK